MSGLELNKIAAAVLVAGIVALGAGLLAEGLYHTEVSDVRGYQIEGVADASAGGDEEEKAEEAIDLVALMAKANAAEGEKITKKCTNCHTFTKGGANKVGPNLWNVLGNKFAHTDSFTYSKAFYALEGGWDYDNLYQFLRKPKKYVKGTKMAFAGLRKPEDIANVLAYIRTLSDNPLPLPSAK